MPGNHLPLRALVVFEAAARLGSFRSAAHELGLTPSAVSHQVRLLEAGNGVALFLRAGRGVTLSPEGRMFFESIREEMDGLRRATAGLAARAGAGETVRLQTPPSFAKRWLLPRLPALLERRPSPDIRVNAEGGGAFESDSADLTIVYGDARRWRTHAAPLLVEHVQPLCAPSLLKRRPVTAAADLLAQTLIQTRVNLLSWEAWLPRHGLRRPAVETNARPLRVIHLDPSDVAIEAATKGLGVVLESDVLTETERSDGRLVAPLPGRALALRSYWLTPRQSASRPAVKLVRDWLLEIAAR